MVPVSWVTIDKVCPMSPMRKSSFQSRRATRQDTPRRQPIR